MHDSTVVLVAVPLLGFCRSCVRYVTLWFMPHANAICLPYFVLSYKHTNSLLVLVSLSASFIAMLVFLPRTVIYVSSLVSFEYTTAVHAKMKPRTIPARPLTAKLPNRVLG